MWYLDESTVKLITLYCLTKGTEGIWNLPHNTAVFIWWLGCFNEICKRCLGVL